MHERKDDFIARKLSSFVFRSFVRCRTVSILTLAVVAASLACLAVTANEQEKVDSALTYSAVPLRDRAVQEHLRQIEAMISRKEYPAAISQLREMEAVAANPQILVDEVAGQWQEYRDSHSVIEKLLESLPATSLQSYRRQVEPLARTAFLKAAKESDFSRLRTLPSHFPMTDAAADSLRFLMARHLDRQEFAAADSVARRLARLPGVSNTHRESALRIIELCDERLGQRKVAPAAKGSYSKGISSEDAPEQSSNTSEGSVSLKSDSGLPLRARLFPFLVHPDWRVDSELDDEAATLTRHALHEHFEQSIPLLPRARPLIAGDIVVRRSLTRISAHAVKTGHLLWSSDSVSEAGQSASRLTMNLSLQELMAQKLARGLQVASLQSRLSSDGKHVFSVESGPDSGRSLSRRNLLGGSNYQSQPQNRIVARNLRNGNVEWSLTIDSVLAEMPQGVRDGDDESSVDGIFFCGLPVLIDRAVVGLVQVGDLLRLYAADSRTGEIVWMIDVAEAARLSPADLDWRSLDCRVSLMDGVLVCPTGAGLLVGVDLGLRKVIWSRRYARADAPLEVTRLPFAPSRPQRPWWKGWRDNQLLKVNSDRSQTLDRDGNFSVSDSILIAAGPDVEEVNALDPRSGRRLWSLAVESPIDLVSHRDRLLILERHFVGAVDVRSGAHLWKVPCREPVGTGYTVDLTSDTDGSFRTTHYVFPVRGGSLIAVNLEEGSTIESVDRLEALSGCLVWADNQVLSLNADRLSAWPMLAAVSDRFRTGEPSGATQDEKDSTKLAIELAVFERSCGMFAESAERLREASDPTRAGRELWQTLLAWIKSGTLSAERLSEVESEAERLTGESSIADLIELRHAAARSATAVQEPALALSFYASLQSLNPSGEPRFLKPEPLRGVRHDRLIQGEVLDLLNSQNENIARKLTQQFTKLAETAESSRDPFALQRFTRQWASLPMAASFALDDRSRIGMRYGQKQLSLLALADSSVGKVSTKASEKLVALFESRSYDRDAASVRRAILRQDGGSVVATPLKVSTGSPWNNGPVEVSEHAEQNLDTTFIPVPVKCSPGTLFDRLNVAINPRASRNDTIIRFYGDGISGSWQTVLPTAVSPLKSVGRMYRGWGIGHLLVLQLGAELFGISPFDSSGEPRVQRLWSVDMANGSRQEDHQYSPAVMGFSEEELTMLDAFGRPIAKVGPVRAGYLCFQNRGRLVCLDPASGQRLWQRYELPRQTICDGDGENVYLIQPREDRVIVLRAVDGATVKQFRLSRVSKFRGKVLQVANGEILLAKPALNSSTGSEVPPYSQIALVSLRSESVRWSRKIELTGSVFAIGPDWLGILHETGKLEVVDRQSGQGISTCVVDRPQKVRAIHVASDASTHVIAISDTVESIFLNGRPAGGSRNPAVTGQLVAIDASSAELKWQRKVDRIRFQIDQPKNVPCILLSYRRSRSSGTQSTESVLHIINRETGDDILQRRGTGSPSSFTFEPHADQNRLSIRMARKSIRLSFSKAQTQ